MLHKPQEPKSFHPFINGATALPASATIILQVMQTVWRSILTLRSNGWPSEIVEELTRWVLISPRRIHYAFQRGGARFRPFICTAPGTGHSLSRLFITFRYLNTLHSIDIALQNAHILLVLPSDGFYSSSSFTSDCGRWNSCNKPATNVPTP